jgi:all-trans-retinol 13,14-reductase
VKKCVIIGSGLGGLSCGCILAKNGYEVTVLEKDKQIGGCLQCFRRGDAIFDTGMHYIGSAEPGQVLHTIYRYLGIDSDISLSKLDPMGYDVISFGGDHYRLANGKENFIHAYQNNSPKAVMS